MLNNMYFNTSFIYVRLIKCLNLNIKLVKLFFISLSLFLHLHCVLRFRNLCFCYFLFVLLLLCVSEKNGNCIPGEHIFLPISHCW